MLFQKNRVETIKTIMLCSKHEQQNICAKTVDAVGTLKTRDFNLLMGKRKKSKNITIENVKDRQY